MKKMMKSVLMATLILVCAVGISFAGKGNGLGNGTGPLHDVLGGEPFAVSGTVVQLIPGEGLLLAVDGSNMPIYGIGPDSYWDSVGVVRPAVGDRIDVTGFEVDFNGEVRNIAMTITVGDYEVQLRDDVTGLPLWR